MSDLWRVSLTVYGHVLQYHSLTWRKRLIMICILLIETYFILEEMKRDYTVNKT